MPFNTFLNKIRKRKRSHMPHFMMKRKGEYDIKKAASKQSKRQLSRLYFSIFYSPMTSKLSTIKVLLAAPLKFAPSLLEEHIIASLYVFSAS